MSSSPRPNQQIADDVKLGRDVRIFGFVNLYGCTIGDESKIGTFVEIQKGAVVGRRCKVSSHTFICEGVTLEDEVFVGHGVMFTNDLLPRATNASGGLQTEADWTCLKTLVKRGASIGSGATVLGGIVIGERAIVGAGAVVTRDIPADAVVAGNPQKFSGNFRNRLPRKVRITKILRVLRPVFPSVSWLHPKFRSSTSRPITIRSARKSWRR